VFRPSRAKDNRNLLQVGAALVQKMPGRTKKRGPAVQGMQRCRHRVFPRHAASEKSKESGEARKKRQERLSRSRSLSRCNACQTRQVFTGRLQRRQNNPFSYFRDVLQPVSALPVKRPDEFSPTTGKPLKTPSNTFPTDPHCQNLFQLLYVSTGRLPHVAERRREACGPGDEFAG